MKIIIAKTAGFCMGVKRAVDLAFEHSGKTPGGILTLGPLIHNRHTVEMLTQRGVTELDEKDVPSRATILIRAHGVSPETQRHYARMGHIIYDGTCPKVKTVHKAIERYRNQGYSIIIAGDKGHAEVIGLLGYAGDAGYLVQLPEDIAKLPSFKKVCLVSQTTFDRTLFDQIAERVKAHYGSSETVIKKTICAATDQRQSETRELAKIVDAMIVVGGKESANTQRLAKISKECGTPTQHVESEDELEWEPLSKCRTIGITAGASTPNWMIKRVFDYLQFMATTRKKSFRNTSLRFFDILANLNVLVSIGAVVIYYASCHLQGFAFTDAGALLAFLYFFSMYLLNSLASIETTQHLGLSRYRFYNAHKGLLTAVSGIGIVAYLSISLFLNLNVFYLIFFATIAGSAYNLTIVPESLRKFFHYKNLKDIPTSRDLFVALAWGTVLTFIPQVLNNALDYQLTSIATFCWIFILAYLRSLIFDLRDIEGDRIMGRETLITIIGEARARNAIYLMIWSCLIGILLLPVIMGMGISAYFHQTTIRFLFQIPVLFYVAAFVKINPKIRSNRSFLFNPLADGLFYLAGFGSIMAAVFLS